MSEPRAPESSTPELEQLMVQYQGGDADAARALAGLLSVQLHSFFASQMGDRAEAEDMTQETWLRIHRVRRTYRHGEPLLPWVYAIARRVRIDAYRKRRRLPAHGAAAIDVSALPSPEGADGLPTFADLVAPLPASQREALTLLQVNGLTIEEIARATASTSGAVKQKVHRAYERLRVLLRQEASEAARGGSER